MSENTMPTVESPKARKVLAWVSWALAIALPGAAGLVANMDGSKLKTGLIVVLGMFGAVAAALKGGLTNPLAGKGKVDPGKAAGGTAVLLCLLLIGIAWGGCGRYAAIRTAFDIVGGANDVIADGVARSKCTTDACKKAKAAAPIVHKAVDGTIKAGRASVDIAERVGEDRKAGRPPDYLGHLKRAVCALTGAIAGILGVALPDGGAKVLGYLDLAGNFVCVTPEE